jgi:hypothetical protein
MFAGTCIGSGIDSFYIYGDVKITRDIPADFNTSHKTVVIFFALPNGNSTDQTMGKKMEPGDDWHYDIQHIRAQTMFLRNMLAGKNIVVIYLENNYKSWPSWKQKHIDFRDKIPHMVDSLAATTGVKNPDIYLNGHSGGGSFIFGYLAGLKTIPATIKRISFIDSDYGYDSSYLPAIKKWLKGKQHYLTVFAYNDSVALYNGKPVVSATGGTWYRSHLLMHDLSGDIPFDHRRTDSLLIYKSSNKRVQFYFKINLNQGIYHTQQVELNGFIHSVLCGTKYESEGYDYYGKRAYSEFIR